ncbi:MAG: HDOD domain-containing protein [Oceanipulchritudo sp.]
MSTYANRFSAANHCRQSIESFDDVILNVRRCPAIGSLRSVNEALGKLTAKTQTPVNEIADVISRDLSLTARLLRLVNSVFGGLTVEITSIEEAIFFLGLRQIRQMAMTTRIIQEMEAFSDENIEVDWKSLWRHSIGTAILTREVLSMTCGIMEDDTYYICGLLHDIGKLVMLHVYPRELEESMQFEEALPDEIAKREKEAFGWNHCEIGALYLEENGLSRDIVEAVLFHHSPENALTKQAYASGIQLGDHLARFGGCEQNFERITRIEYGDWENLSGWGILFSPDRIESQYARASVLNSIERLPSLLHGLL